MNITEGGVENGDYGNASFVPTVQMKNAIGTVVERTIAKENRTKAFHATKEARSFAKADFEQMVPVLTGQSKYNVQAGIDLIQIDGRWHDACFDCFDTSNDFRDASGTHHVPGSVNRMIEMYQRVSD